MSPSWQDLARMCGLVLILLGIAGIVAVKIENSAKKRERDRANRTIEMRANRRIR